MEERGQDVRVSSESGEVLKQQNESIVSGDGNIVIQGSENVTINVHNSPQCCHDGDCVCACSCCRKTVQSCNSVVAIVPYAGSSQLSSKYHSIFDYLFKLRHYGQYEGYEKYVGELRLREDFKTPGMQVLVKLSDAYCVWIKGEPMQKERVDGLLERTDSRLGFEALWLHVSLLRSLQEGKLVDGMRRSYGALQTVHHLPPGYLKGFILSFAGYLHSLLIADETDSKAREILRQEGIEYCKLGVENADEETGTRHLSVTCANLKSTCLLYLAMLHLDAAFTAQTASRGRRVSVEHLTAAGEALIAATRSNPAPFTRARILLVVSDFNFRQWQVSGDRKYHEKAVQNAKEAKKLAERFRFLSEIEYARERVAFLEEQLPLCGG
ncbi:hypothetical protein Bbelb_036690 [Branchiostoma belcheri]|nr:hypothetical protein Bbelb_036690 [Branchiostoma belcheri]